MCISTSTAVANTSDDILAVLTNALDAGKDNLLTNHAYVVELTASLRERMLCLKVVNAGASVDADDNGDQAGWTYMPLTSQWAIFCLAKPSSGISLKAA